MTDVLRRGGRLLRESCPRCGGVLIQYQGRTLCFNCDNISGIEKISVISLVDIESRLKSLAFKKIEEAARQLENEADVEKQTRLAELLLKYIDMLKKVSKSEKTGKSKED